MVVELLAVRSVFDNSTELVVEIHAGEGGDDSKNFVSDLFAAYAKWAVKNQLKSEILESDYGHIICKFSGIGCWQAFKHERGKHCVQRCPKTERNGRRHTSIVSVAVLPLPPIRDYKPLPDNELEIKTQRRGGPGGQHQNTTDSAVRIVHKPTGLLVLICGRDQHQNKQNALRILTARVNELRQEEEAKKYGSIRQAQLGGGKRGEKIRTYNFIRSSCVDHVLNKKTTNLKGVMEGRLELIIYGKGT